MWHLLGRSALLLFLWASSCGAAQVTVTLTISETEMALYQLSTGDTSLEAVQLRMTTLVREHIEQVLATYDRAQLQALQRDLLAAPREQRTIGIARAREALAPTNGN